MSLSENISIKTYNTFGIDVNVRWFAAFSTEEELKNTLEENSGLPLMILGGGSNMLWTKDFDGMILKNEIMGRKVVQENENELVLEVGAGEVWHDLVMFCVENGWGGIENLSLIPGCAGAAPIQNIGAYGVELKDVFVYLTAMDISTGELRKFTADECTFGYRESVFKRELKGKYIICRVAIRLTKKDHHLNTSYGAISQELEKAGVKEPGIRDISNAVIAIRRSKLPDPAEIGNAGSFFKNPEVSRGHYDRLLEFFPDMPAFPISDETVKVPAGWLIEQCGWKGKRIENYGVHAKQALVLVNYGGAKGMDIYNLSEDILQSVDATFGIRLEREVNILP